MNNSSTPDSSPRRRGQLSAAGRISQQAPDYYASPDWWRLRAAIMKALRDFPEARASVVTALRALNAIKDSDDSLA